jgi:hypothetical protein
MEIDNKTFERGEQFIHLEITITNRNPIQEGIKR